MESKGPGVFWPWLTWNVQELVQGEPPYQLHNSTYRGENNPGETRLCLASIGVHLVDQKAIVYDFVFTFDWDGITNAFWAPGQCPTTPGGGFRKETDEPKNGQKPQQGLRWMFLFWGSWVFNNRRNRPGMMYFPIKWRAKEPQNPQDYRVVKLWMIILLVLTPEQKMAILSLNHQQKQLAGSWALTSYF